MASAKTIKIEQTGSPMRRQHTQRETLIGLKLNKIGRVSSLPDTPMTRGMIDKVNIGKVQAAIDAKLLDAGAVVDAAALIKAGVLRRAKDGVRLLGNGEIKAKVNFEVFGASKSAVEAVEKAGGSVKILAPKREEGEKAA